MKNLQGKVAVITGAGSGIGRALSQQLAALGCRLALADRNPAGLKETLALIGKKGHLTFNLDVTNRAAVARFAKDVEKKMGGADLVINNAGINSFARVTDTQFDVMEKIMAVNFWGTINMTKAFLPQLLKKKESTLVNISSTLGLRGFFGQAIYSASKFAVRGFSEALQTELKDSPLNIVIVYPGGVKTQIHNSAFNEFPLSAAESKKAIHEMNLKSRATPDQAAQAIVTGIQKKKLRVLIGVDAFGIDVLTRLMPDNVGLLLYLLQQRDPFWSRTQKKKQ